jgi:putative colanic acid biosynthesis UDP-glucose lipid carrier transferase
MNKQFLRFLQTTLFSLDMAMLNLVFITSRFFFREQIPPQYSDYYFQYWIWINIIWIICAWLGKMYGEKIILSFELFFSRTVKVYLFWFSFLVLYEFFTGEFILSRLFIFTLVLTFGFGLILNRFAYIGLKLYVKKGNRYVKRILIVGYNNTSKKLASYLEEEGINTEIVGFTENEDNVTELSHYPILSDIKSTVEVSKKYKVDEIFSSVTPEQNVELYPLILQAEHECIRFRVVPDFSVFIKGPFFVSYLNDMPILTIRSVALDDFNNRVVKRIFDFVMSSIVILFILSWLIPLISLLIFIESPGPVFFSQFRTGKNKKSFLCYKFRSMKINKDADVQQATKNDDRITKIGKFLRRTSLDEFPQFINVLIGNMSIVGPRPHMIKHTDDYSKLVDQYMVRHLSKPGITGWAQVNGYRGEITETTEIKNRVHFDIWYLENWSLLLDIKIVFLTVFNVLKGEKNAY